MRTVSKVVTLCLLAGTIGCRATASSKIASADNQDGSAEPAAGETWVGNFIASVGKGAQPDPCGENPRSLVQGSLTLDDRDIQQADVQKFCFEVYAAGISDNDGADYASLLDVKIFYRYKEQGGEFKSFSADSDKRVGNNRRYVVSLPQLYGPLRTYIASSSQANLGFQLTKTTVANGAPGVQLTTEYYVAVNGTPYYPDGGSNFVLKSTYPKLSP